MKANQRSPMTLSDAIRDCGILTVRRLIKRGASVHDPDVVCTACEEGNVKALKMLIDAKVDLNVGDCEPMVQACRYGHSDIVKMMLDAGASVTERAVDIARKNGYRHISELLAGAGGHAAA